MKRLVVVLLALSSCLPLARAQQPGSAQYNSVLLPAHGAGDARARGAWESRWSALAIGTPIVESDRPRSGFSYDQKSKGDAERTALEACSSAGNVDCTIEMTASNVCTVSATGPARGGWGESEDLAEARAIAFRECGTGCKVRWEGCSLPVRVR